MPTKVTAPGLLAADDPFAMAGQPGRGSDVGDFVPGKNGGWVPKNHPDAGGGAAPGGAPGGGGLPPGTVGANAGEAGPSGPAMAGLNAAAGGGGGGGSVQQLPPQGASNPNLGQRIYPMAMRQLSMLPRIY